jgi:holliday junction DNA helicase ruvA
LIFKQREEYIMYAYIKGILAEITEDAIIVENQGIGYEIAVPGQVFDYLPSVGEEVKIYTYHYVREDAILLYGFLTKEDVRIFKMLIGVSGIGPKGALAILSVLSTDDLRFAILGDDAKAIAKAPGVGAKTAQRVIIELKDKLSLEDAFEQKLANQAQKAELNPAVGVKNEAILALTSLGYSQSEALKVLQGIEISPDDQVEDVLKMALKQMAFL